MKTLITLLRSTLLVLLIVLGIENNFIQAQSFAGGSGTQADPYQVATAVQLDSVRHHLSSHFKQTADIDLNVASYNNGTGWIPIPTFSGSYDGGSHTISNLMINRPNTRNVGLFGIITGGSVKNLGLTGANVTGDWGVGTLAGSVISSSSISRVKIRKATVTATTYAGGLTGQLSSGSTIRESNVSGSSIQSSQNAGGLVGYHNASVIRESYTVSGSVTATTGAGGLVGISRGNSITRTMLTTSYSSGIKVSSEYYAGGLVGEMYLSENYITNSYSINQVNGVYAGGLVSSASSGTISTSYSASVATGRHPAGLVSSAGNITITNSYYNRDSTSATTSYGTPLTDTQMKQQAFFTGFDFTNTWLVMEGVGFPRLQALFDMSTLFSGGSGTQFDPYQVATANQLNNVRLLPAAYFKQTADIDLGVAPFNTSSGWLPIPSFSGTYNGNGFTITNLYTNHPARAKDGGLEAVGLFGSVSGATLTNLALTNVSVKGYSNVGALVGSASENTTISRIKLTGGTVDGHTVVGGLAGYSKAAISEVAATRMGITYRHFSEPRTGGLVGEAEGSITKSYAINKMSNLRNDYPGALVGFLRYGGTITNSYAASSGGRGLVNRDQGTITNSYFNRDSSAINQFANGTPLYTAQMSQQASFSGWDFTNTWEMFITFPELQLFVDYSLLYDGGSGTQSDPYRIQTGAELNRVRRFPSAHFKQTADISLKAYQSGDGWLPIPGFTGSYDGGGYTISDLKINRPNTSSVGLFADITRATLTNLTLSKPSVKGNSFVGALVGVMSAASEVSKIHIKGNKDSVEDSVKGAYYIGGLVGSNDGGSISLTAVTDMGISATGGIIGGLAGATTGDRGSINNSYAINTLSSSGNSLPGALVGYLSGTITNSYGIDKGVPDPPKLHSVPDPDNTNYLYELVNSNGGTITNSYYICNPNDDNKNEAGICISDIRHRGDGTPLNMFGMRLHASFPGWDFTNIWYMEPNSASDSPRLRALDLTPPTFAGGSGTTEDPYLVENVVQLASVGLDPTAHYKQIADINVGVGSFRNRHTGWRPFPNFTGTYDGNGHSLFNLQTHFSDFDNIGLFSKVTGGTLTNIVLVNPSVKGKNKVGALVGEVSSKGKVIKVRVTGGKSTPGAEPTSKVEGKEKVGALAGSSEGTISKTASTGINIEATGYIVGGLVGYANGAGSSISDSYAINTLSSSATGSFPGGLVGVIRFSTIRNSYTASSGARGVVSSNTAGTIINSYYNKELSAATIGGTALTPAQMKQQASFTGFDFTNTWIMFNESVAYPNLRAFPDAGNVYTEGKGTEADPYRVATPSQLNSIRFFPSLHFRQTANIDLNVSPFNTGKGWEPIPSLSGSYDGGGFIISNLLIDRATTNNVGLFGTISGGSVTNLGLMKVNVKGKENVGALAGYLAAGSEIRNAYAKSGTIQANKTAGGLVGKGVSITNVDSIKIRTSYSSGINISAVTDLGGLAGEMQSFEITDSYAINRLDGAYGGGLVGRSWEGLISNSYSSSRTLGANSYGVMAYGKVRLTGSVYVNSDSSSANGGTPLKTEEMRQQASFGFDFTNTWQIKEGSTFPELRTFGTFSFPYTRGTGTQADPFQVSTAKQLDNVRNFSSAHFIQTADINLGVRPYNGQPGWLPIPNFTGSYDGNGFAISNLTIYRLRTDNLGLFAKVTGATLSNITLKKPFVFGNGDNTGVLAGAFKTGTTVRGVRVIGGNVRGTNNVGGLVGSNEGKISLSAVTGMSVDGFERTGGLVGSTTSGSSIANSYAINKPVDARYWVGGLVGWLNGSTITNSYSSGKVTSTNTTPGGLVGNKIGGSISNSYYNKDYVATSAGGTGLTTDQMKQKASFAGFDFANTWIMFFEGGLLPGLQTFVDAEAKSLFAGGAGTEVDPYKIATAKQLYNVRRLPSRYYRQTADINLGVAPYKDGAGWLPIKKFTGTYDGGGFSISNLTMNQPSLPEVGLFGRLDGGTLTSLNILNPKVSGNSDTGALVGSGSNCELSFIRVSGGTITGTGNNDGYGALAGLTSSCTVSHIEVSGLSINISGEVGVDVGGMIGKATGTTISRAGIGEVNLDGKSDVGGIAGELNTGSSVSESAVTGGTIVGKHSGGLVGRMSASSITNSYSTTEVDGTTASGGLVRSLSGGSITTSYSSGAVYGANAAGLVSSNNGGTITNSYYDISYDNGNGHGTALTVTQMQQKASFTGFNFATIWFIDEGVSTPGFQERKENELIISGKEGWRMLTSPLHSHSIGTLFKDLWLQGFKGADKETGTPNLYVWDEAKYKWTLPSDTAYTPGGGKGFLIYVYSDDNADGILEGFPKRLEYSGSGVSGDHTINLSYTSSEIDDNDGWNLVGNPYPSTIHWDAVQGWTRSNMDNVVYVWSESANTYLTWNGKLGGLKGGKLAPWQAFWVRATGSNPRITFTDAVKSAGGALFKQASDPVQEIPHLTLELEGNGLSSTSIVMFDEQAEAGKDPLDAYKLQSLNQDNYLLLGTSAEGQSAMDIQALPLLAQMEELELVIEGSNLNGELSLSWTPAHLPEGWLAELVDTKSGEVFSLADTASYAFSLNEAKAAPKEKETSKGIGPPASPITPVIKSKKGPSRFAIRFHLATSGETDPDLPQTVELQQNYPNPFNPSTTIAFGVPEAGKVTLEVFDVLGRKVATLLDGENKTAGRYNVRFDARELASGMYIYRLQAGDKTITKKLTLIK